MFGWEETRKGESRYINHRTRGTTEHGAKNLGKKRNRGDRVAREEGGGYARGAKQMAHQHPFCKPPTHLELDDESKAIMDTYTFLDGPRGGFAFMNVSHF